MSRVGTKISTIRNMKGMTQKQLAKAVGTSEKFIEEVESGKKVVNDELLKRFLRVLEQDVNELERYENQEEEVDKKDPKAVKKVVSQEVQKIWNDAFESMLKTIPIYDYTLSKVISTRQLPVTINKIEGYPKDKVMFIEIQDNDMIGFRMIKGDTAFAHQTNEIESNSICLVEYSGQRLIRQLKRLDGERVLLIGNDGRLATETVHAKDIKVLARLDRLEIKL